MTYLFALLAALANAASLSMQHIASTSGPPRAKGWRLVAYLAGNPLWLLGWIALFAAFVFQGLALHLGLLSVVQTLLITELVFGLVLRKVWIRQRVGPTAWAAAAVTCAAMGVFLAVTEPRGGNPQPTSGAWASSIIACVVAVGALALIGTRGTPSWRAASFAIASGITWALEATFIKALTDVLATEGVGGTFSHWPLYAVIAGGVVGNLLMQVALHVGPLKISQPLMVIVDPIVAIVLAVHLFQEHFVGGTGVLAIGAVAFAVMCASLVALTAALPDTLDRPVPETPAG